MIFIQALVRNVRTLFQMRRKMTNGQHHEEEYRCWNEGRSLRSSDEASVMEVERRGGVIRPTSVANLRG